MTTASPLDHATLAALTALTDTADQRLNTLRTSLIRPLRESPLYQDHDANELVAKLAEAHAALDRLQSRIHRAKRTLPQSHTTAV